MAASIETGLDLKMPTHTLFDIDELLVEDFDLDAALAKVAAARAAEGRP